MTFWTGLTIGALAAGAASAIGAWVAAARSADRARAAERRALEAERLAEIGAMTGGLAHEIKNPLSTIGLNAQLLSEGLADLELPEGQDHERARLVRRVGALRREAERLRDVLEDFLRFAGDLRLDTAPADLNDVVEELVDFYLPQAEHHGVRLRSDPGEGDDSGRMPVHIDSRHFKQGVLNLLLNATQAMEGAPGGQPRELILRTAPSEDGADAFWSLHVIDTGPGIPAEDIDRVFKPYFTTKSGGSGLGLPTTKRLIEAQGGRIGVHSEPGRGTDFRIDLPRAT